MTSSTTRRCYECSTPSTVVMTPTDEWPVHQGWHEANTRWRHAIDRSTRTLNTADEDAEQAAYTALCDFCDENDIDGTRYDPRTNDYFTRSTR